MHNTTQTQPHTQKPTNQINKPKDDAIRALFSSKTRLEYSVGSLATFAAAFFALALASYGAGGVPTGLFVPGILVGAAYGRLVGVFVAGARGGGGGVVDEGTYALLGAASFLGGSMRLTVCTCVMLLELTNNLALLPLVMLVLLVAKAVGDGTGVKPVYETLMEAKGLPFLEPAPDGLMRHITAAEACGRPAVCFRRVERVAVVADTLRATRHSGCGCVYVRALRRGASACVGGPCVLRHSAQNKATKHHHHHHRLSQHDTASPSSPAAPTASARSSASCCARI